MDDGVMAVENEFHVLVQYPDGSVRPATKRDLESGFFMPISANIILRPDSVPTLPNPRCDLPGIFSDRRLYMPNGGCMYLDTGSTPEHAGPECRGPREAALYNIAGQLLITGLYGDPRPDGSRVVLFKHNLGLDQNGLQSTTVGMHENYQTKFRPDSPAFISFLIPFLASRQIITGNGWVDEQGRWCYSQRALCMSTDVGSTTTSGRSILSTRDEPHTGVLKDKIRRLHIICGDANMSEYQIWLSLGITALVISMIQDGVRFKWEYARPMLSDHTLIARQMRSVSYDFADRGQTRLITLKGGGRVSAYTLQTWYLEEAEWYLKKTNFASEQSEAEAWQVLHEWTHALNAIYANDTVWLGERLDYMMKWRFMEEYRVGKHIVHSPQWILRQRHLELKYHELPVSGSSQKTMSRILHERYPASRLFTDAEIAYAQYNPPQTTRARMRGKFVEAMMRADKKDTVTIDWSNIWYRGYRCNMFDPLQSDNAEFASLMSYFKFWSDET
ncbi:MAG: proteasome accessory factor PafA2 family protein [Candidatus Sungbacteria bacterium]|nr:proteasome accessory factor PafA2 family protein [Candidatus Sungbacteria bacterium]